MTTNATTTVSWAAATWTVPVIPTLWFLGFLVMDGATHVGDNETAGWATGVALALVIAVLGGWLSRVGGPSVRGAGFGLAAGGLACAIPCLWMCVT